MPDLDSLRIKGHHAIYCNGNYIVLAGKSLWIYKMDGTLVAHKKEASNVCKVAFLPDDCLLTGWGRGATYRLISLNDGTVLWESPHFKISHGVDSFAVTPDGTTAYDCYGWQVNDFLVRIDIKTGELQKICLSPGLFSVHDIICDRDGTLFTLESYHEEISGQKVSQNGIQKQSINGIEDVHRWKYRWQRSGISSTASGFLGNIETVISNGLDIYEPATGQSISILERNPDWNPPYRHCHSVCLDGDCKYLTLLYPGVGVAIVDMETYKVIAQYAGSLSGCIVGNEYWISSETEIKRLPFPYMEELEKPKTAFWT